MSLAALLAIPAGAQTYYGSVVGTVTDSSGAAIPDATVKLINTGTQEKHAVQTQADGNYRFVNVLPGNYNITATKPGFKLSEHDQIAVDIDSVARVDIPMSVGEVTETVAVSAAAPLLQTENASLGQVLAGRAVQALPLNGRNVLNLVALTPGVVTQGSASGTPTGKNVFAAGNYQINGGTANQSAFYYDGVPMNIVYGNLTALNPTQDAVAEFRVQTNNNTAEYGRYTGGVINIVSKSGTNDFHGGVYEYLRNRVLNAGTYYTPAGQAKSAFTQNQFGVNLGGPIIKDKLFFFASYEGFRLRQGVPFDYTVPTPTELTGNFSGFVSSSGAQIPIYDPLSQCGAYANPACTPEQVAGTVPQRQQFPGNVIPPSRINPIALNYIKYPYWAKPNVPGQQAGNVLNYFTNADTGGNNNQLNFRGDYQLGQKQRLMARWTRLQSANQRAQIYGNGLTTGDPYAPDFYTTNQAVIADTVVFSPTLVLDVRGGLLRWWNNRVPGALGMDIPGQLGFPSYYSDISALDGIAGIQEIPEINISSPTVNSANPGPIRGRDTTYTLTPTLTMIRGSHTIKVGGDVRKMALNYYQNNQSGGQFSFDNLATAGNALNSGATGSGFASFLLGLPASGTTQISPFTHTLIKYQGYFVSDTWLATQRLTVTAGLRWEIPGSYMERNNNLVVFNPTEANPALSGVNVSGQPVAGAFDLVASPNHPERGLQPEAYHLFAPRLGLAYRLTNDTVVSAGGGRFFVPATVSFLPILNPDTYFVNTMAATINKEVTFVNTLSDPYPGGLQGYPGRGEGYQSKLLGTTLDSLYSVGPVLGNEKRGYTWQWNLAVQHQFKGNLSVDAAYAGTRGMRLPMFNLELDQLNPSFFSLGSSLNNQVANPFYKTITTGALAQPTVALGQLLSPFPQYQGVNDVASSRGDNTYHALQMKAEKRFSSGGTVLVGYTFSKILTNTQSITSFLDNQCCNPYQNADDLRAEKSLSLYDTRQLLSIAYVHNLPIGRGERFLSNVSGVSDKLVSGWAVNGITTFQDGLPLSFTASPNVTGFRTGLRPNYDPSCKKKIGGGVQSRLNEYFNTACFSLPAPYTFGNESRTDPTLRGPGIANYDFALAKTTGLTERFHLEFVAEAFNLFNRVQFASPNTSFTTSAGSTFGQITAQVNTPRLIQLGLRLNY